MLERRTLAEQVYDQLRSAIMDETYPPGQELLEVPLAAEFGVSRGPIREALRQLAADKLVTFTPRRGAVVRSLTRTDFLDAYQVREALELLAVRLATPLLDEEDFAFLDERIEAMDVAIEAGDNVGLLRENLAFHRRFVERTNNAMLMTTYQHVADSIGRYQRWSVELRGDLHKVAEEHRAILDRVRARDVDGAVERSRQHIEVPLRKLREEVFAAEQEKEPDAVSSGRG